MTYSLWYSQLSLGFYSSQMWGTPSYMSVQCQPLGFSSHTSVEATQLPQFGYHCEFAILVFLWDPPQSKTFEIQYYCKIRCVHLTYKIGEYRQLRNIGRKSKGKSWENNRLSLLILQWQYELGASPHFSLYYLAPLSLIIDYTTTPI